MSLIHLRTGYTAGFPRIAHHDLGDFIHRYTLQADLLGIGDVQQVRLFCIRLMLRSN